ncbi:MAG TPA: hypothetical protein VGT24_05250 [Candidatus Acidoferrales bacterium]|nr:hypothetical protein [Candidatus Acidoferrales bacterium]
MILPKEHSIRGAGKLPGEERRRSQRVIIRVPITLELLENGKAERIVAHTVAVNIHGAMIVCARNIDGDTRLEMMNERTRKKAGARVTRPPRESAEGFLIPLEFTASSPDFWQISFPPTNWKASES